MNLLAIDPGNTESAWLVLRDGVPVSWAKEPNDAVRYRLRSAQNQNAPQGFQHLAIEMVQSFGMPVGFEVFQTCFWVGRFVEAFQGPHDLVYRKDVKLHLCHDPRAKDPNIRQALIDRFGGKDKAVGTKKSPGVLRGIHGDCWSALAIACVWHDKHKQAEDAA